MTCLRTNWRRQFGAVWFYPILLTCTILICAWHAEAELLVAFDSVLIYIFDLNLLKQEVNLIISVYFLQPLIGYRNTRYLGVPSGGIPVPRVHTVQF